MSRVYWHSPTRTVELHGSERHWLGHVAAGPGTVAWDLGRSDALDRAAEIMALIPEPSSEDEGGYLHAYFREARAQDARNRAVYAQWKPGQPMSGPTDHEPIRRFVSALQTALNVRGIPLRVAGVDLHSGDVELNTALVAGSDPIRLAAKLHGWCESHCWVEGPYRAWLASVIDEGLAAGIFRSGFWYVDAPHDGPAADHPDRKWSTQGWEDVTGLLRERDDEPVVLSYSVTDGFPNASIADYLPWPDGVERRWDALSEEQTQALEDAEERWGELPDAEQWRLALAGLRASRPWAQLTARNLATITFGPGVTVYDLFAPDRDERVRATIGATP